MCIYQNNEKCELDYIELDPVGSCRECIRIDIDKKIAEKLKKDKKGKTV